MKLLLTSAENLLIDCLVGNKENCKRHHLMTVMVPFHLYRGRKYGTELYLAS
jgi:hypothetical protein